MGLAFGLKSFDILSEKQSAGLSRWAVAESRWSGLGFGMNPAGSVWRRTARGFVYTC